MKKTLLLIAFAIGTIAAQATRPLQRLITVKQADGKSITVTKQGNHCFCFYTLADGTVITKDAQGRFCYAQLTAEGLEASALLAHEASERSQEEILWLKNADCTVAKAYSHLTALFAPQQNIASRSIGGGDGLGTYGESAGGTLSSIGTPTIPVILVEFPDRKFMETTTDEKVSRFFNEKGYQDESLCHGSVNDYFTDQSNGLFSPKFDIVAHVTTDNNYAYYGANSSSNSVDPNAYKIVSEVVEKAIAQGVDFSKYATGGSLPLVSLMYAGPGEHSAYEDGCEDYLWAHYNKYRPFTTSTGINVKSYFMGNEVLQSYAKESDGTIVVKSQKFDGMGVFIHEIGHALNLPDFYYTGNSSEDAAKILTPCVWSIMDYGQYLYDGYAPIGYNAYERSVMGWLNVEELTEATFAQLYPFGDEDLGATAYCIKNPSNASEYYLLENRQADTWFPSFMGTGMLVWHVAYNANRWNANTVNNTVGMPLFNLVPANNTIYETPLKFAEWQRVAANLYPGTTGNTSLTDDTTPATTVYTGSGLSQPIYNIAENDGVISFSFIDPSLTGIVATETTIGEQPRKVYTIDGRQRGTSGNGLAPGVYIVKQGKESKKVFIK